MSDITFCHPAFGTPAPVLSHAALPLDSQDYIETISPVSLQLAGYANFSATYPYLRATLKTASKPKHWVAVAKTPSCIKSAIILKGFCFSAEASSLLKYPFESLNK